tara:strand:- start:42 stop:341 length:300 start_codon:yes stop_codon:yes gene_type:complete
MNKYGNISYNLIMVLNNIETIRLEHFAEKRPKKYDIPDELKKRCKKLKILLSWEQIPSDSNNLKERRLIWKPEEILTFECDRKEKKLRDKKREKLSIRL